MFASRARACVSSTSRRAPEQTHGSLAFLGSPTFDQDGEATPAEIDMLTGSLCFSWIFKLQIKINQIPIQSIKMVSVQVCLRSTLPSCPTVVRRWSGSLALNEEVMRQEDNGRRSICSQFLKHRVHLARPLQLRPMTKGTSQHTYFHQLSSTLIYLLPGSTLDFDVETPPKLRMWMNLAIESAYKDRYRLSTVIYDDEQLYICLKRYRKCIIIQYINYTYDVLYIHV